MSDLLLRVTCRDGGCYRNPWLTSGTSIPLLLVLLPVVVMFFPSLFTPYTPEQMDFSTILQPPDLRRWLGTDQPGRDVFTRVVYGTPLSLNIGIDATLIASTDSIMLGTLAGLASRVIRQPFARLLDIVLAFPDLLLALLATAMLGCGPENTLQVVGLADIVGYARLVRVQVSQVRLSGYVQRVVALGEPLMVIISYHIVPNTLRPPLVPATVGIGYPILSTSALSFLGLGVTPSMAEWGALFSKERNFLDSTLWVGLLPASVAALSAITTTLLGRHVQTLIAKGGIARLQRPSSNRCYRWYN